MFFFCEGQEVVLVRFGFFFFAIGFVLGFFAQLCALL